MPDKYVKSGLMRVDWPLTFLGLEALDLVEEDDFVGCDLLQLLPTDNQDCYKLVLLNANL